MPSISGFINIVSVDTSGKLIFRMLGNVEFRVTVHMKCSRTRGLLQLFQQQVLVNCQIMLPMRFGLL